MLVLLVVKYVSDKYAGNPDSLINVPEGGSFADMVACKGDKEIGDKFNQIIAKCWHAEQKRSGSVGTASGHAAAMQRKQPVTTIALGDGSRSERKLQLNHF